jgi:hypothetical protein
MPRWLEWLLIAVAGLLVIGLIAYARGPEHHEGDTVGSHGTPILLILHGGNTTTTTPEEATTPPAPPSRISST